jgi:hypothetical protein
MMPCTAGCGYVLQRICQHADGRVILTNFVLVPVVATRQAPASFALLQHVLHDPDRFRSFDQHHNLSPCGVSANNTCAP